MKEKLGIGFDTFQFTPLREGRRDARGQRHVRRYFNSRPSARGDAPPLMLMPQFGHFNSRPSARGDEMDFTETAAMMISIHAPPRGATHAQHCMEGLFLFQFTPLREGRHVCWRPRSRSQAISIHAPPRGATPPRPANAPKPVISIHAPPRGATVSSIARMA